MLETQYHIYRKKMSNIKLETALVDGSSIAYINANDSCEKFVEFITGDDIRPPVQKLEITIMTKSGKSIVVIIPNSDTSDAIVRIDGTTI
jgi:hypothetical protein